MRVFERLRPRPGRSQGASGFRLSALSAGDKAIALTALLLAAAIGAIGTALVEHHAEPAPALLELRGGLQ